MGFKIKNSLTGEFEKLPILTLKGEKGETGGVEEYNKVDYMGNKYETLKQANDANVEYAVKTAIGEFNYLDYDGQHITATETIEGRAKSAILSGQTLVNLLSNKYSYINLPTSEEVEMNSAVNTYDAPDVRVKRIKLNQALQANKKYILLLNVVSLENGKSIGGLTVSTSNEEDYNIPRFSSTGLQYKMFETKFEVKEISLYLDFNETTPSIAKIKQPVLMEYQDGMENWDIPYFEGMASVKAPVLKSVGKNLFDGKLEVGNINSGNGEAYVISHMRITDFIKINENKTITISKLNNSDIDFKVEKVVYYDINKNLMGTIGELFMFPKTLTPPTGAVYIRVVFCKGSWDTTATEEDFKTLQVQIEEGSAATPFEPHKSNILSTPEDLELHSIKDTKYFNGSSIGKNFTDVLNYTDSELKIQINKVVMDGNKQPILSVSKGNVSIFKYKPNDMLIDSSYDGGNIFICDKLKFVSALWEKDEEGYCYSNNDGIMFSISNNKFTDINEYLSQNPITFIYPLAQESIKTVDLSDNHVYSYKGTTHYDCSSAKGSLVPTLSVKVPTDVQATIAQQRETIQTLNSENERLNQIQEALKASMLDSQVQLMNLSWNTDFEVFTLRESIAPKDSLMDSKTGSNIDKFSQAKFIIENDCPDLEKLNSQIEYYFSKDVFSQEQFEELTDLISIVKGENGCEY